MKITLDPSSVADYERFLRIKSLPTYRVVGRTIEFPDRFAGHVGFEAGESGRDGEYQPSPWLFDYQRDIAEMAIRREKFAVFADCGLGKTLIFLEYIKHVASQIPDGQCVLLVSPLMVVGQTLAECRKFYGDTLKMESIPAAGLSQWLTSGTGKIGVTNYDALSDETPQGRLAGLVLDESSMLKSHYGAWGQACLRLGEGLRWKLAGTGTPAPNDRIEYANHAVFVDQFPTVNAFLAKFFINRGQTDNRWELKAHAVDPFYRSLADWSIFINNPGTYGWKDNCGTLPPIHVHIHDVDMTKAQRDAVQDETGDLFVTQAGGIMSRSVLSQIAKGNNRGESIDTLKPEFIRRMVDGWPDESTIIWCLYNDEQELMEETFPEAASITGDTPLAKRLELIEDFKAGRRKVLISKGKILGFGLNLQICTRMVFSGLQDSYETFYQCVKRANRYGSTKPLNVHIPVTQIERPMIDTVLSKAKRVQKDTEQQEEIFRASRL
jgi:superfamily II DNA or RNA helicase